jgi:hypothetical protein
MKRVWLQKTLVEMIVFWPCRFFVCQLAGDKYKLKKSV